MLYDLIYLSWFDAISVAGTFFTVVIIQLINANIGIDKLPKKPIDGTKSNGELSKQKRKISADVISSSPSSSSSTTEPTTAPATPTTPTTPAAGEAPIKPTNARHSLSSLNNISITPTHPVLISSDIVLSDEYHEDEDTLSLDNLFPCDQTEIHASKKICYIIDELIQTETNYVNNLRKGLQNYGKLNERQDLPQSLQGMEKQQQLLGNIDEILELHEKQILPLMLRNQRDLKTLFDEFAAHLDKDNFYAYVIFMMNKKTSMQLRQEQREWFQNLQNEIKDKLGIDSFLVQPIQRLTRYPLLLQQFISEFYKSGICCKPVLMSVCKLETRMRRILEVVNQAEEITSIDDMNELNIQQQGRFRRSTEFEMYHYRTRKKYRSKVFLFDQCLLCADVRKKRLVYRLHLPWNSIELLLTSSKSITVLQKTIASKIANGINGAENTPSGREELELSAPEAISVTQWLRCARRIIEVSRIEAQGRCRFSLPMDLVLGVVFAIWAIWHYLY